MDMNDDCHAIKEIVFIAKSLFYYHIIRVVLRNLGLLLLLCWYVALFNEVQYTFLLKLLVFVI